MAYAANPDKRGLDLLCEAWAPARPAGARLASAGSTRDEGRRWLGKLGGTEPAGVEWLAPLEPDALAGAGGRARACS